MNEQYQKSLTKLELDKVLALLADHASSPAAKERCLAVRPLDDAEDIRLLQAQTSAACKLITLKGSPSFGWIVDVGGRISRRRGRRRSMPRATPWRAASTSSSGS